MRGVHGGALVVGELAQLLRQFALQPRFFLARCELGGVLGEDLRAERLLGLARACLCADTPRRSVVVVVVRFAERGGLHLLGVEDALSLR